MSTRSELVRYSDILPILVEWVWNGYIPAGMFSLLDGDPGLGKSTFTADLAARISTGRPMPDGTGGGKPRGVILLSSEDDRGRTIRPRFDAAGADPDRVFTFDIRDSDGSARPPMIVQEDLARLERIIRSNDAAMVVFDPLSAYLPDGLDTNRDANVRRVLYWLAKLAGNTGCAVLGLRHFRKSPSENPQYRGGGSIAFIGAARAAYLMAPDPDDPAGNRRILAPTKMNVGPLPVSLAFRLAVDSPGGYPHLIWEGPTPHTAASLSAIPFKGRRDSERERAVEVLAEVLADGPLPAAEVYRLAGEAGVREHTVDRAKSVLGVRSRRIGRPGGTGAWLWEPPKGANNARRVPTESTGTLREGLAPFEPVAVEEDFPPSAWDAGRESV